MYALQCFTTKKNPFHQFLLTQINEIIKCMNTNNNIVNDFILDLSWRGCFLLALQREKLHPLPIQYKSKTLLATDTPSIVNGAFTGCSLAFSFER